MNLSIMHLKPCIAGGQTATLSSRIALVLLNHELMSFLPVLPPLMGRVECTRFMDI